MASKADEKTQAEVKAEEQTQAEEQTPEIVKISLTNLDTRPDGMTPEVYATNRLVHSSVFALYNKSYTSEGSLKEIEAGCQFLLDSYFPDLESVDYDLDSTVITGIDCRKSWSNAGKIVQSLREIKSIALYMREVVKNLNLCLIVVQPAKQTQSVTFKPDFSYFTSRVTQEQTPQE